MPAVPQDVDPAAGAQQGLQGDQLSGAAVQDLKEYRRRAQDQVEERRREQYRAYMAKQAAGAETGEESPPTILLADDYEIVVLDKTPRETRPLSPRRGRRRRAPARRGVNTAGFYFRAPSNAVKRAPSPAPHSQCPEERAA